VDNYVNETTAGLCKARLNAGFAALPVSLAANKYSIKSMVYVHLGGPQRGYSLTGHRFVIFVHN
jgi:hypothetical protein